MNATGVTSRFHRLLLFSAALGVLVGLFCALFTWAWHFVEHLVWGHLDQPIDRIWFSASMGLVIGVILTLVYDPGSMATIILHFHKRGGLPMKDNLPILPVSVLGLVAGQSAGPEGALTQAGGSLGGWLSRRLDSPKLERVLTLAGMGAGFGAFLGAPVGGALLWLEMLHTRGLEYYEAIIPTLVCSCVGYLVMLLAVGHGVVQPWHISAVEMVPWWAPLLAVALGVACVPFARFYSLIFRTLGRLHLWRSMPLIVKTTVAGLVIGLLGYFVPQSYFYGSSQIPDLLRQPLPVSLLVAVLLAKMIAASFTVRGHWQGGLIIPHMFMGAVIGKLLAAFIPGVDPLLAIFCCMAGFNAAATQTPLASALIVLALTGYGFPVPVFIASLTGFLVGQGVVLIENKQSRTEPPNFHLEPVDPELVP